MKILMTGATGLVGRALGIRLVREGHEVVALARDSERARAKLTFPCQLFAWDGEKNDPPAAAFEDVDVIIHLAGEGIADKNWSEERKQHLRESRVQSAEKLARAARGTSLKAFISASAIGYYGDRADEKLTEASTPGYGFLSDLCRDWENAADQVPAKRTVKLRFGVILSSMGGFLSRVVPLFQRLGASRLGSGAHYFSWIHIDDVVEAILLAINNNDLKGAVNVVAPNPVTNAEMTDELAKVLKCFRAPPVPGVALKLRYGEMSEVLLGSQRVAPRVLFDYGFKFRFERLEQALLNLYPDLESGEILVSFAQWVPKKVDELWSFFSSEHNLEKITPPILGFHVLGKNTDQIQQGTLIDYRLKIHGVPVGWQTLISVWDPGKCFVDEQVRGPYKKWHHTHEFEPLADGTLLKDTVRFRLPMGLLGRGVALGQVMSDVSSIFEYRSKVVTQTFYPH